MSRGPVRRRPPLPPGFAVIWTTVALDLVGFGILFPVLARYAEDFGASPATAGALVASFSVAQLVCSPLWGRVSDRVGRRPVLIVSLVGTAVGSLLTGLAGALWVLFAGRIVDGISGASVAVAQAAVTDVATPEERPRLLGLLGAAFGFGFAAGPVIGGLAALVDKRAPFLVAALIAAVNALVAARRLPETHPRSASPGALSTATGTESVPVSVENGRSGAMRRLVVVFFLALVAFSGFEATFSLLAAARFDLSESGTYAVFFVIGLALVGVQGGLIRPVVGRLGETPTLRAGFACNVAGLVLLAVDGGWATLAPALTLLVVGQGLVAPTVSSMVAGLAGNARRGAALGVQQSAGGLARSVGPALGGFLFGHAVAAPYLVGAGLTALALLIVPSA